MSTKLDFRVSLRVFHPTMAADDIAAELRLQPKFSHSVGRPRVNPKGMRLEGQYDRTYVSFSLEQQTASTLEETLERAVDGPLAHADDFITKVVSSGGRIEFFIGLFCEGNSGIVLEPSLLKRIAAKKLTLSFDIHA
jgi:hypothetical protein